MRWRKLLGFGHFMALGFVMCAGASAQTPATPVSATSGETAYRYSNDYLAPQNSSQVSYQLAGPETQAPAAGGNGACGCNGCCDCIGNWWDNTLVFVAGDSWKGVGDAGSNNSFGIRSGFNTGFALGNSNLRGQIGGSLGFYDFRGRALGVNPAELETQMFLTAGVYKRSDIEFGDAWSYGAVWDVMNDNNYGVVGDALTLSQIRGQIGYALDEANEIGVWGAFRASDETATVAGLGAVNLRTVNQANLFWHHNWAFGGDTNVYVGVADGLSAGTFGLNGNAPLSDTVSLFGNFNYYGPSAGANPAGSMEEFWNVSFGIAWFPGAKASNRTVSGWRGLPLLDVANNGTFQITP
jgi:hypothetical protein